ncbi:MAG TPA: hypothetical protein VFG14_09360 [Chthoniobacteraceae bacterium]|nr:hypothetical protein [Chthoniobacteraceae bacterium]
MIDPFTRTRYNPTERLETWYPEGLLDHSMAALMVNYIGFAERVVDEPFNRFADLSRITAVRLNFIELATLAAERREAYGGPPVKSAFLAVSAPAYGVARMFGSLMEASPIDVEVFRNAPAAAQWLDVPVQALQPEWTTHH